MVMMIVMVRAIVVTMIVLVLMGRVAMVIMITENDSDYA